MRHTQLLFPLDGARIEAVVVFTGRTHPLLLGVRKYPPFNVVDQIISIFAATNGYLDSIPETDVNRYEKEMLQFGLRKFLLCFSR